MRRVILAATAAAVVAGTLIAPVVAPGQREPIAASLTELPISGIDAAALVDSDRPSGSITAELASLRADEVGPQVPVEPAVVIPKTDTDPFGLVAVSSAQPLDPASKVRVRVREDGAWGEWTDLPVSEHAPDPDSPEAADARYGTEPLLTDDANGVQVRIDTPDGDVPPDTKVAMLENPTVAADADMSKQTLPADTAAASTTSAGQPPIITRAQWGADESKRGSVSYADTIKVAFIHHTTSTTNYTPEQAAAQMRNLYGWYVSGLHYSDMAYNFLVDRYGRLFEGRGGGVDKAVIGAHTAGFNVDTFAVSVIGNMDKDVLPPEQMSAMTDAISSLIAWKLSMYQRDPNASATLTSNWGGGTSKYAPGEKATTPVISGHGDIGSTACPGRYMFPQIPGIRANVLAKMGATMMAVKAAPTDWGSAAPMPINMTTTAPITYTATIDSLCGSTVRHLSGALDAPGAVSVPWDLLDDNGKPVPPGQYRVTISATSGDQALYPWTGLARVRATASSPPDPCGPPATFTLHGSGYGHGVGLSQWGAYAQAKAGWTGEQSNLYYFPNTTIQTVKDDVDTRVGLLYQVDSASVRPESLGDGGGGLEVTVGNTVALGTPADSFSFSVSGSSVKVTKTTGGKTTDVGTSEAVTLRWAGTRNPGTAGTGPTLVNVIGPGGNFDGGTTHRYKYGYIEVLPVSTSAGTKLSVVNSVRIHDEYLKGISEVSSSWPLEALKAQVIASRSYALAHWTAGKGKKTCWCHVDDGGGPYYDQTFAGYAKESGQMGNRWVKAVNETAVSETEGRAVVYDGKPISAFYTASTGGMTNSSADVWGGSTPYTGNVDDHWSLVDENPDKAWTKEVTQAQLASTFGVSGVASFSVSSVNPSGSAKTFKVITTNGDVVEKSGSTIRSAFGLKSGYVNLIEWPGGSSGLPGATPVPTPTPTKPVKSVSAVSMSVSSTAPRARSTVRFSGAIAPKLKGITVQRQVRRNGAWAVVAQTKTAKGGKYAFSIAEIKPAGATYRFRTVAIVKKKVVAKSATVTVTVRKRK